MEVEGEFQRVVLEAFKGTNFWLFTTVDSNGKEVPVSYSVNKDDWLCTCEARQFNSSSPCCHIKLAMEVSVEW